MFIGRKGKGIPKTGLVLNSAHKSPSPWLGRWKGGKGEGGKKIETLIRENGGGVVLIGRNTAAAPGSHKTLAHNVYPGSRVLPSFHGFKQKDLQEATLSFIWGAKRT